MAVISQWGFREVGVTCRAIRQPGPNEAPRTRRPIPRRRGLDAAALRSYFKLISLKTPAGGKSSIGFGGKASCAANGMVCRATS